MSSLTGIEKRFIESTLGMETGWVLHFGNDAFAEFFREHGIDIHSSRYQTYGTSKAKKLRAFWESENDLTVGKALSGLLDVYEANCELSDESIKSNVLEKSRKATNRLLGKKEQTEVPKVDDFLQKKFSMPPTSKLPVEQQVVSIIDARIEEAQRAFTAKAYLSVIFLCGSVLEAVLLGAAQKEPAKFNKSVSSPKDSEGKVRPFHEWKLSSLIDVSCNIGILKKDVKSFSHGLRDFRNYIHPYEQMVSGFTPDEHTANVCFHVLKAALASVAGERS